MEDNPYFQIVPPEPFVPSPLAPNELHRGDWWSVFLENEGTVLEWISGEFQGRLKRIVISKDEAQRLIADEVSADEVLRAHNTG